MYNNEDYYQTLLESLLDTESYLYLSFIFPEKIFMNYCNFLFTNLFYIEDQINKNINIEMEPRIIGYIAEILFDCFIKKNIIQNKIPHKECMMSFINNTEDNPPLKKKIATKIVIYLKLFIKKLNKLKI